MKKFGQITIFIILGVILISIFLLLIYVKKSIFDVNNLIIPSQVKPVEVYVDSCISKLSKEAYLLPNPKNLRILLPLDYSLP